LRLNLLFNLFSKGQFDHCLFHHFIPPWHEERLTLEYVYGDGHADIDEHVTNIRNALNQTLQNFGQFFFVMIYTDEATQRPTFGLVSRLSARFHDVRFRCYVLAPEKESNYPNYSRVLVPNNLCTNHPNRCMGCNKHHTELVEYSKILVICTTTTPTGNLVSTMTVKEHFDNYTVYDFKKEYEPQQMTDYKTLRLTYTPNLCTKWLAS